MVQSIKQILPYGFKGQVGGRRMSGGMGLGGGMRCMGLGGGWDISPGRLIREVLSYILKL